MSKAISAAAIERSKQTQVTVANAAEAAVARLLPDISSLSLEDAAGAIRTVATGVLDQFGILSISMGQENALRFVELSIEDIWRNNRVAGLTQEQLFNQIQTNAYSLWVRRPFEDVLAQDVESIAGYGIKRFSQGATMSQTLDSLQAGIGRSVSNIYRSQITSLSDADPRIVGYQRVAAADACVFCMVAALRAAVSTEEPVEGYHDRCGCTAVPVFRNVERVRPDYYDKFEEIEARALAGDYDEKYIGNLSDSSDINEGFRDLLQSMRAVQKTDAAD